MEVELIVDTNRKISLSSFEKQLDGSCCAVIDIVSSKLSYSEKEFYFEDFPQFIENLEFMYSKLKGSAELRFHHESDYIKFEAQSLGHIEVMGEFLEYGEIQQNIYFGFVFDQSYLPSFIENLKAVSASLYS